MVKHLSIVLMISFHQLHLDRCGSTLLVATIYPASQSMALSLFDSVTLEGHTDPTLWVA